MNTAERIVIALRERPLTRPELSIHIVELTSRALLYQLKYLQTHGFVTREGSERSHRYRLIKEDGLLVTCHCCKVERPCWLVHRDTCHYCTNVRGVGEVKPKQAKKAKASYKVSPFAKDDACSLSYQRLLRGQRIGIRLDSSNKRNKDIQ
ncbi:hypothetical protein [Photobacterium nomapromontoriensis]|uniref:hypothetical protein n=1 Tax=Photobacterium nomapromontoriensis TaxID=2910237 RepID=UPI003D102FC6